MIIGPFNKYAEDFVFIYKKYGGVSTKFTPNNNSLIFLGANQHNYIEFENKQEIIDMKEHLQELLNIIEEGENKK